MELSPFISGLSACSEFHKECQPTYVIRYMWICLRRYRNNGVQTWFQVEFVNVNRTEELGECLVFMREAHLPSALLYLNRTSALWCESTSNFWLVSFLTSLFCSILHADPYRDHLLRTIFSTWSLRYEYFFFAFKTPLSIQKASPRLLVVDFIKATSALKYIIKRNI